MKSLFNRNHERGQDLVEFALALPLLLLILLGIMEFGIVIMSYDTIANAAREGARFGVVRPWDTAGIQTAARRLTTGLDPSALTINVTQLGNTVRVQVTYDAQLITGPVIQAVGGNPTLRLRTAASMQTE